MAYPDKDAGIPKLIDLVLMPGASNCGIVTHAEWRLAVTYYQVCLGSRLQKNKNKNNDKQQLVRDRAIDAEQNLNEHPHNKGPYF